MLLLGTVTSKTGEQAINVSKLAGPGKGEEGKRVQGRGRVRVGRGRESDNQTRTASSPAAVDEIDDDDFSESARDERRDVRDERLPTAATARSLSHA